MKKSFTLLLTLSILILFSFLIVFVFEIKALKSENIKNEYLQTQAQLHLNFLDSVAQDITDDAINTLHYEDTVFSMRIENYSNRLELFVYANQHAVSLHKTIIK